MDCDKEILEEVAVWEDWISQTTCRRGVALFRADGVSSTRHTWWWRRHTSKRMNSKTKPLSEEREMLMSKHRYLQLLQLTHGVQPHL